MGIRGKLLILVLSIGTLVAGANTFACPNLSGTYYNPQATPDTFSLVQTGCQSLRVHTHYITDLSGTINTDGNFHTTFIWGLFLSLRGQWNQSTLVIDAMDVHVGLSHYRQITTALTPTAQGDLVSNFFVVDSGGKAARYPPMTYKKVPAFEEPIF